jgi:hypothetical protein
VQKPKKTSTPSKPQIKKTIIVPAENEVKLPRVTVSIGPTKTEKKTIRAIPQSLSVRLRTALQNEEKKAR